MGLQASVKTGHGTGRRPGSEKRHITGFASRSEVICDNYTQ